jgi:hypothetical protein
VEQSLRAATDHLGRQAPWSTCGHTGNHRSQVRSCAASGLCPGLVSEGGRHEGQNGGAAGFPGGGSVKWIQEGCARPASVDPDGVGRTGDRPIPADPSGLPSKSHVLPLPPTSLHKDKASVTVSRARFSTACDRRRGSAMRAARAQTNSNAMHQPGTLSEGKHREARGRTVGRCQEAVNAAIAEQPESQLVISRGDLRR